ncbi:MAG: hypothetical protein ABR502_02665 [Chitinophagaceae bacterium]
MRSNKQKTEKKTLEIAAGKYVNDFIIAISFTNGVTRLIDFLPLFHKYVKGENLKYFAPQNFKKFNLKNGNIYWGKNEDVIFPVQDLYNKSISYESEKAEVLYVI